MKRIISALIFSFCALLSGAQTLTATYVQLADSADYYIRHERWNDAERVTVKALKTEPANKSNYLLWSNLGIIRTQTDNLDGALDALDIGLASAPNSTMLLTNRAKTYLLKGDSRSALADFDSALALDSTLQWPRKMRGLIRESTGDRPGAKTDFDIYIDKFGEDADIFEAQADMAAAEGDGETSVAKYKKAYKLNSDGTMLGKALLTAYLYGKLEDMAEELQDGLRQNPRDGMLYLMRAMLKKARYQNSEMEEDLKTARQLGVDERIYQQLTGGL